MSDKKTLPTKIKPATPCRCECWGCDKGIHCGNKKAGCEYPAYRTKPRTPSMFRHAEPQVPCASVLSQPIRRRASETPPGCKCLYESTTNSSRTPSLLTPHPARPLPKLLQKT